MSHHNNLEKYVPWIALLICCVSFLMSCIESSVNMDSLHWGLMYGPARDLSRGAIPHKETLIAYGYLTSLIQGWALLIGNGMLMSLGIVTGFFYSLSLALTYLISATFLNKKKSLLVVAIVFLVHPYMIYPWANYFSYFFQLLGLYYLVKAEPKRYELVLAGVFTGCALLARYSAVITIVPPLGVLLLYAIIVRKRPIWSNALLFASGTASILTLFALYLIMNDALGSFIFQNKAIVDAWGRGSNMLTVVNFFTGLFCIRKTYANDIRGYLFSVLFVFLVLWVLYHFMLILRNSKKKYPANQERALLLSVVALWGYLNALHLYETFRIVNGGSIGIASLVFAGYQSKFLIPKLLRVSAVSIIVLTAIYLLFTLVGFKSSSSYYPWRLNDLENRTMCTTSILSGKYVSRDYMLFYKSLWEEVLPYQNSLLIINFSGDGVAMMINKMKDLQHSPYFLACVEDTASMTKAIDDKMALVLTDKPFIKEDYCTIWKRQWPGEVPWLKDSLYVSIPMNKLNKQRSL